MAAAASICCDYDGGWILFFVENCACDVEISESIAAQPEGVHGNKPHA